MGDKTRQAPTPVQSIVAGAAAGGVESLVTVSTRHGQARIDPRIVSG